MNRSEMMSRIKGKDTKPELLVRKSLFALGFRYRVNVRKLPGSPDIVLPKYRAVIFINGCFWHGHDCEKFRIPKTNTAFWLKKIENNRIRDGHAIEQLSLMGWRSIVIWECTIKKATKDKDFNQLVSFIADCIKLNNP